MTNKSNNTPTVITDVVIVGYGGAGAVAAIAAHELGTSSVILEKLPSGGGATRLSSGGIYIPQTKEFANYLDDLWQGRTPRDVIDVYVEQAMNIEEYCASIGVSISHWKANSQEVSVSYPPLGRPSWPLVRDGSMIRVHATAFDETPIPDDIWQQMSNNERVRHIGRTYGINLWEQLKEQVEKRDIPVHFETKALDVVKNDAGEVTGVIAEKNGSKILYHARKAVILATGGFASNEQMKEAFLPCPFVYAGTNDFATGDGHAIAARAGARFWHMLAVCGQVGFKAPEFDQAFQPRAVSKAFMWVDGNGKRYTNETNEKLHNAWRNVSLFDPENNLREGKQWPRIPMYMVFDESMRKNAPISRDWRPNKDYEWSLDNRAEIERGWIKKGDTLADLAVETGMNPETLENTVCRFNECCQNGTPDEFGRDLETMATIENGPYYALPLVPMLISTQGGPEHDKDARVLDQAGNPIPRLYAAGELSSIIGWLYEAGGGHAECIVFGKIAGENAAHEAPID